MKMLELDARVSTQLKKKKESSLLNYEAFFTKVN